MFAVKKYVYEVKETPEHNFREWLTETNYERYKNQEQEYTISEGAKIFNSLYACNVKV
tara:strand:+ start:3691 stop:3864 length:174 start_codon:yes stop_codon:yes gene_type:complete